MEPKIAYAFWRWLNKHPFIIIWEYDAKKCLGFFSTVRLFSEKKKHHQVVWCGWRWTFETWGLFHSVRGWNGETVIQGVSQGCQTPGCEEVSWLNLKNHTDKIPNFRRYDWKTRVCWIRMLFLVFSGIWRAINTPTKVSQKKWREMLIQRRLCGNCHFTLWVGFNHRRFKDGWHFIPQKAWGWSQRPSFSDGWHNHRPRVNLGIVVGYD